MRHKNPEFYDKLLEKLQSYPIRSLRGLSTPERLNSFTSQIIASTRRIEVAKLYKTVPQRKLCSDPSSTAFDPLKAASWHRQNGNLDEAFWLVFLATNFGRSNSTKWNLVKDVYSGLSNSIVWDWETVSQNVAAFRDWMETNHLTLRSRGKVGNHRKYHRVDGKYSSGTGAAVSSYVDWIGPTRKHETIMNDALTRNGNDKRKAFNMLYKNMSCVKGFGRMGKFDYLTMAAKLGLVDIIPDSTYMNGATGPFDGARILFGTPHANYQVLDNYLQELEGYLGLDFGMQVIEDAICNWQKSPNIYKHFGG